MDLTGDKDSAIQTRNGLWLNRQSRMVCGPVRPETGCLFWTAYDTHGWERCCDTGKKREADTVVNLIVI